MCIPQELTRYVLTLPLWLIPLWLNLFSLIDDGSNNPTFQLTSISSIAYSTANCPVDYKLFEYSFGKVLAGCDCSSIIEQNIKYELCNSTFASCTSVAPVESIPMTEWKQAGNKQPIHICYKTADYVLYKNDFDDMCMDFGDEMCAIRIMNNVIERNDQIKNNHSVDDNTTRHLNLNNTIIYNLDIIYTLDNPQQPVHPLLEQLNKPTDYDKSVMIVNYQEELLSINHVNLDLYNLHKYDSDNQNLITLVALYQEIPKITLSCKPSDHAPDTLASSSILLVGHSIIFFIQTYLLNKQIYVQRIQYMGNIYWRFLYCIMLILATLITVINFVLQVQLWSYCDTSYNKKVFSALICTILVLQLAFFCCVVHQSIKIWVRAAWRFLTRR